MSQPLLLYLLFGSMCLTASETDLTINVDPENERCFYAPAEVGDKLDIRYHVIQRGDEAESRIGFYIATESSKIVASDISGKWNSYLITAGESGDYKVCFGNFITYSIKQVNFITSVKNTNGTERNHNQKIAFEVTDSSEDYQFKLFDIEHQVDQIGQRLYQARQQQRLLRLLEARDRNVADLNFQLVNRWSLVQVLVMVIVLAVQVLLVRNFFSDPAPRAGRRSRWK